MPHHACDPVIAGAQIVSALQTIVARNADPIDRAVVSSRSSTPATPTTSIPQTALLGGTARSFTPAMRDLIERRIGEIAAAWRRAGSGRGTYEHGYPATVNSRPRPSSPRPRPWRWSARTRSTATRCR